MTTFKQNNCKYLRHRRVIILTLCVFFSGITTQLSAQVYKFKSKLTDTEVNGVTTKSIRQVNYHTFDFNKKTVTFESKGETITYKMKRFYQEGITTVIVVNEKGMKEIWFSTVTDNIGYDLFNGGIRVVHYEIEKIK